MVFGPSAEQRELRDAVARLCARFDDEYWLKKDEEGGFPHEFHQAMAEAGWLGIAMPEAYGGSGLGICRICHDLCTDCHRRAIGPDVLER